MKIHCYHIHKDSFFLFLNVFYLIKIGRLLAKNKHVIFDKWECPVLFDKMSMEGSSWCAQLNGRLSCSIHDKATSSASTILSLRQGDQMSW
jgi:hypothetical protein